MNAKLALERRTTIPLQGLSRQSLYMMLHIEGCQYLISPRAIIGERQKRPLWPLGYVNSLKLFLEIVINGSLEPQRSAHFNRYVSASVMGHCNGITVPNYTG